MRKVLRRWKTGSEDGSSDENGTPRRKGDSTPRQRSKMQTPSVAKSMSEGALRNTDEAGEDEDNTVALGDVRAHGQTNYTFP